MPSFAEGGPPAGTYKWKSDDYNERSGGTMMVPDWMEKAADKYRPMESVTKGAPNHASPVVLSTRSSRRGDMAEPWDPLKSPTALEHMTMMRTPTMRRRGMAGTDSWDWCVHRNKEPFASGSLSICGPGGNLSTTGAAVMRYSLSSPSTLTAEGRKEAQRVLGTVTHPGDTAHERFRPPSERFEPSRPQPKTTNQNYGSRADMADRNRHFHPIKSSDVVLFKDNAVRTKTPYDPAIRF
eukprot:TRINITY_DN56464_c0_g1_i1.p1 TRINITY_DN56464_c0_g1~~TRINITY_DN56464_c0_g1_i1.p1  ORF type:complete len:238 (-),score=21.82 TRINITY_DN56464_c0_g1_i1:96-809(-)